MDCPVPASSHRAWRSEAYNSIGVFASSLPQDRILSRLRPFNGEYGRDGAEFEGSRVIATVDVKGFRLSMVKKPMRLRQVTSVGRWEPVATGSRFNLTISPIFSTKVLAIRFGFIALLVSFAAIADLLVIRLFDLHPPPVPVWTIGLMTNLIVVSMYLWLLDPVVIRRTSGEFESHQIECMKRFVAAMLDARETFVE